MGVHATANAVTREITLTTAPVLENGDYVVDIDVKVDLYSDMKEDWISTEALRRVDFPIQAIGGQPLPGSRALGSTFFLADDWTIVPYSQDHRLRINGNLYKNDGTTPFTDPAGYSIFLEQTVSSLVDSTIAQLTEIEFSTFQDRVTINTSTGVSGTTYPTGTGEQPSSNIADALTIATTRGLDTLFFTSDYTFDGTEDISNYKLEGKDPATVTLTLHTNTVSTDTQFKSATVAGTLKEALQFQRCYINGLTLTTGKSSTVQLYECRFGASGMTLPSGQTGEYGFYSCRSDVAGSTTPVIDMNGGNFPFFFRDYIGGVELRNITQGQDGSVDMSSGHVKLPSSNTSGTVILRGVYQKTDNSGVGLTVTEPEQRVDGVSRFAWEQMVL